VVQSSLVCSIPKRVAWLWFEMKCLGASSSSPRDLTFGSKTSLGPFSVSPRMRTGTRAHCSNGSFSRPTLPAQRLRTVVSADTSPESILLRLVLPRGPTVATVPIEPYLAGQRTWQATPPGAVATVSTSDSAVLPESYFSTEPAEPVQPSLAIPIPPPEGREGQRPASNFEDFSLRWCVRPGCYEVFVVRSGYSLQRFCSCGCRRALRNVLEREFRYRQRRRNGDRPRRQRSRPAPSRPP